ncbi:hypothetical protein [Pseudarthrobacter sp. S9]|uniref:hypothetical protein n=1 Tax=Pseudarthrobacter sp. S9 TaxID=3418421 RepID=UPI003D084F47
MAYTYPAMVAWDPQSNKVVKNTLFQVYATSDTAFTTPLAITDPFGNPIASNILNSGAQGVFPQFQQALNSAVVLTDSIHTYAWTVACTQVGAAFRWAPNTPYAAGQQVIAPNGDPVSAISTFTSGASYSATNWNPSVQDTRLTAVETKNTAQDGRLTILESTTVPQALTDAKTYTDGQVATDRGRLTTVEGVAGNAAPYWKASTAYTAGQRVVAPNGDVVSAIANFTSGASYSATNWTASTQDGRIAATETGLASVPAQTGTSIEQFAGTDDRALRPVDSMTWPIPFMDKDGYMAGAFDANGALNLFKAPVLPVGSLPIESFDTGMGLRTLDPNSGYVFGLMDQDGYMAAGLSLDGYFTVFKGAAAGASSVSSRTKILCVGDSLTRGYTGSTAWDIADSYPSKLAGLLPDVSVVNQGFGGNPVDEIRLRVAALKLYLTPVGGVIPASGAVDVTTRQAIGWVPGNTVSLNGSLLGVSGTFTRSPTSMTFTRSSSGASVTVSTPAPLLISKPDYSGYTAIIWTGRNDVSYGCLGHEKTVPDHVVAASIEFIEWLSPHIRQFAIVGTTNRVDEPRGTDKYNQVIEINTRLAALYPGKYINVRDYLVNHAIYDAGMTPTQADLDAMANDTPPPSIMDGGSHYNIPIAPLLAQNVFYPYLTKKGLI